MVTADLTTVPKYHSARTLLIITGVAVGAVVAGGLTGYHEYEKRTGQSESLAGCLLRGK
jgi:hypothetical protein